MTAKEIGDRGEDAACEYLKEHGYSVFERNYRTRYGEIDIIAKKGQTFVFVEVKTRKNTYFGRASEYVDRKKQEKIIICTSVFMDDHPESNARFDIIEVYYSIQNGSFFAKRINHIKDAFIT